MINDNARQSTIIPQTLMANNSFVTFHALIQQKIPIHIDLYIDIFIYIYIDITPAIHSHYVFLRSSTKNTGKQLLTL